jgi:hypothetical protein
MWKVEIRFSLSYVEYVIFPKFFPILHPWMFLHLVWCNFAIDLWCEFVCSLVTAAVRFWQIEYIAKNMIYVQ